MHATEYNELETLFLALADKTRLRLLALMAEGPATVGVLVDKTGENQPKVSRHLAYLRNCGVVTTTRDGKWIHYSIDPGIGGIVGDMLTAVIGILNGDSPGTSAPAPAAKPGRPEARRGRSQSFYVEAEAADVPAEGFEEIPEYEREADEEMDVFLL